MLIIKHKKLDKVIIAQTKWKLLNRKESSIVRLISEIMHKSNTVMLSDKLHSESTQLYQPLSMPIEEITEYWDPISMHTYTQTSKIRPSGKYVIIIYTIWYFDFQSQFKMFLNNSYLSVSSEKI